MFDVTVIGARRVVFPGETHAFPIRGADQRRIGDRGPIVSAYVGDGSIPEVGVLANVDAGSRFAGDTVVVTVRGQRRLALGPIPRRALLEVGVVAAVARVADGEGEGAAAARSVGVSAANRYRATLAELGHEADVLAMVPDDPIDASYRLASLLRISEPERQHLLESETAAERLRLLATVFERERALLEATISAGGH